MNHDNDNELPRTRAEAKRSGVAHYFTGNPCKHGHVVRRTTSSGGCMECVRERKRVEIRERPDAVRERKRRYKENNLERERERERNRSAIRRAKNPEYIKGILKRWRDNHAEEERARGKEKYHRLKDVDKEKKLAQARVRDAKRQSTLKGKLENSMSTGVHRGLRGGSKAGRKTFDLLGYTVDELRMHLEKQFAPGMTWENYGEWHVDHKIPRSAFNYETPDHIDFKRCWALLNLQPLWAFDNISKHAKLTEDFQPSLALAVNDNQPAATQRRTTSHG